MNVDAFWSPGLDLCWDLTKGLPLADGSMKGIYTEHMLEHIPFDQVLPLLSELKRILRKDGTIRIVVPDAELYLDLYQSAKRGMRQPFPYETARTDTPIMHVNRIFRAEGHEYAYDHETLSALLGKAGFKNITKESFDRGRDPNLLIDSEHRKVESLYVEASS